MSIDISAYSTKEEPVRLEDLERRMRDLGWDVIFLDDWYKMNPVSGKHLTDSLLAIGWRYEPALSAQVRALVNRKDRQALEELWDVSRVATCGVSGHQRDEASQEDLQEMLDILKESGLRADYLETLGNARWHYYTNTSAGRSPFSVELQQVLGWAIADISDGLLQDISEDYGYSHEMPLPRPWEEGAEAMYRKAYGHSPHGSAPWVVIGFYAALTALALVLTAMGKSPLNPSNWYVTLLLLHGPLAYGLYRSNRACWYISVSLTGCLLLFGAATMVLKGRAAGALPVIALQGYLLSKLFAEETRDYFFS